MSWRGEDEEGKGWKSPHLGPLASRDGTGTCPSSVAGLWRTRNGAAEDEGWCCGGQLGQFHVLGVSCWQWCKLTPQQPALAPLRAHLPQAFPASPRSLPTLHPCVSHEHTETHPPPTSSFPAAGLSAEVAFAGAANPRAQNTRSHQGKS